jgi:hypothetical protein
LFFIDEIFYTGVLALCRMIMLLFMIRIFSVDRRFRIITYSIMGWVLVSAIIIMFMTLFQCWPIRHNWDGWKGEVESYQCLNVNALGYAAAGSGIAQDLAILLLPIPVIIGLQMPWKKRILTLFMFSLGVFIVITSVLRLRSLLAFAKSHNPTWDYTDAVIWTSAEVHVSVIVLCLPAIRVLLIRLFPGVFQTQASKSHYNTPQDTVGGSYKNITKGSASRGFEDEQGTELVSSTQSRASSQEKLDPRKPTFPTTVRVVVNQNRLQRS